MAGCKYIYISIIGKWPVERPWGTSARVMIGAVFVIPLQYAAVHRVAPDMQTALLSGCCKVEHGMRVTVVMGLARSYVYIFI